MASAITGIVATLSVSGVTLTGSGAELGEASVTIGKDHGKFDPVGTDVSLHATGMKKAEGSMSKRWTSGAANTDSTIYQELVDGDAEFDTVISITGGGNLTVSNCKAGDRSTRIAPGTEVIMETLTFTAVNWTVS